MTAWSADEYVSHCAIEAPGYMTLDPFFFTDKLALKYHTCHLYFTWPLTWTQNRLDQPWSQRQFLLQICLNGETSLLKCTREFEKYYHGLKTGWRGISKCTLHAIYSFHAFIQDGTNTTVWLMLLWGLSIHRDKWTTMHLSTEGQSFVLKAGSGCLRRNH